MSYQNIIVERVENFGIITVNRPQVMNALNDATRAELAQAIDQLGDDAGVRVIIITGAGERAFIAGADIKEMSSTATAAAGITFADDAHHVLFRIESLGKPVIAAINGYALGGGCELSMACDIRLAADTARLGQPEVNLGIMPGWGGSQRLPRLVGRGMANLLTMTGDMIDAQEAWRIGLVDRVVPAAQLMDEAKALARKLASKPPLAIAAIKQAVRLGLEGSLATGCHLEAIHFGALLVSEDGKEGMKAFLEKRKPEFKGR